MQENKNTPIIHGTRMMWARYEATVNGRKRTRLCELWKWHDGTMRVYCGTRRIYGVTLGDVCAALSRNGWKLVQGGF